MKGARTLHLSISVVLLALVPRPVRAAAQSGSEPYTNAALPIDRRVEDLLTRMTLDEKIGQMSQGPIFRFTDQTRQEIRNGRWGSFLNAGSPGDRAEAQRIARNESRLGIPLIFGRDVIHGYRTIFPIPLGQAASWNPELVRRAARVAAREAASEGIHWTFSPMIDIARDPRWGRIAEGFGEDPYLTSALGAAMVHGYQGERLDAPDSIAACAKHYVGYGAAEGGRDYDATWIPEELLRNVYLPPFEAALRAGAATFMSAFNALNGVPATGNAFALRQILRSEWKFSGFVVSDWTSVTEMIAHGYARDAQEAALQAVRAGVDMEMVSTSYHDHLGALVETRQVDVGLLDESVRNILRVKFRLGLFDDARRQNPAGAGVLLSPDALEVARSLAGESMVLLKNDDSALPLSKSIRRLAVVGPLADSPVDQNGTWVLDGRREDVRTPLAAFRAMLGDGRIAWAPGLQNSRDSSRAGFSAALDAARGADAVLLFLGEEQILSGEAHSRAFLNLPGAQEQLVEEIARAGKPMIVVIFAGRPLTFQAVAAKAQAVIYGWHPGSMGGPAVADLVFGDSVPSGKLPATLPRTVGQVPIYYAHMNTGRPPSAKELGIPLGTPVDPKGFTSKYLDVDFTPEYPFGFGLSYTRFEYSKLRVSPARLPRSGSIVVTADVANSGAFEADETVQLYVRDVAGSATRPVRELKGFRRVRLKPGEKQSVAFTLQANDLAFYDGRMRRVVEPGVFHVWIAPDSSSGIRGEFEVVE